MKLRDGATAVDHRRQLSTMPSMKRDESTKKKKAAQYQQQKTPPKSQQQASSSTGSNGSVNSDSSSVASMTTKGSVKAGIDSDSSSMMSTPQPAPCALVKKNSKQQLKLSRERERKEKQAKQNTPAAMTMHECAATPSVSNNAFTSGNQQQSSSSSLGSKAQNGNGLDPDSLKSRNRKLFLAPNGSSSSKCSPSWGRGKKESSEHSVTEKLHAEILEYAKYTRATVDAMAVNIELMIENVRECVHSLWPHSKVETFGSYSTGIWLPSSDVDLVILDVVEVNDTKLTVKNLHQLAKVLKSQAWVESLVLLDTAKMPVLKLISAETSVPIDITFESAATHSGLLARDLIKRYAEELPELYPLAVVFKQLLRERDLNDAYTGGLSSYSIVLMIIHFAQLWRNGKQCFEAAAIYASGSLPPAPSTLVAELQRVQIRAPSAATEQVLSPVKSDAGSKKINKSLSGIAQLKTMTSADSVNGPTSSYASIVARPAVSTNTQPGSSSDTNRSAVPRFSYADVAGGVVKLSKEEPPAKATAIVSPPTSYAAAVAAPAGSSLSSAVEKSSSLSKSQAKLTGHESSPTKSPIKKTANTGAVDMHLDSISVTSSTADTEDSCSNSSSSSLVMDVEEETPSTIQQQKCVSLGEHTMLILEFFGIIFDYRKNGLSVRDGGYIYRLADRGNDVGKPALLVIEDPIHPDRNVSASSFAFSKVVAMLEDSYYALKYFRPSKFTPTALSCLLSCSGHTSHTI